MGKGKEGVKRKGTICVIRFRRKWMPMSKKKVINKLSVNRRAK